MKMELTLEAQALLLIQQLQSKVPQNRNNRALIDAKLTSRLIQEKLRNKQAVPAKFVRDLRMEVSMLK